MAYAPSPYYYRTGNGLESDMLEYSGITQSTGTATTGGAGNSGGTDGVIRTPNGTIRSTRIGIDGQPYWNFDLDEIPSSPANPFNWDTPNITQETISSEVMETLYQKLMNSKLIKKQKKRDYKELNKLCFQNLPESLPS